MSSDSALIEEAGSEEGNSSSEDSDKGCNKGLCCDLENSGDKGCGDD
jgi:hypothetical protein